MSGANVVEDAILTEAADPGNTMGGAITTSTFYDFSITSGVGGVQGDFEFTITESGSSTVINPVTTVSDSTLSGGFAGFKAGNDAGMLYDDFSVSTVPEPGAYALLAGIAALTGVMLRRRRS